MRETLPFKRLTPEGAAAEITFNFRLLRGWTQAQAASWYGVGERTWRRWEAEGAPAHLLNRIREYGRRLGGYRGILE